MDIIVLIWIVSIVYLLHKSGIRIEKLDKDEKTETGNNEPKI